MRPFWMLAIGLGLAWLITSNRAGAALQALLQDQPDIVVNPPGGTSPSGPNPNDCGLVDGDCPVGTHIDPNTHCCIPNGEH